MLHTHLSPSGDRCAYRRIVNSKISQAEEDRSPKAHRLSNGSRVSMGSVASSSPSPSRSLDDSTHGSVTASTSTGASSPTHDHEEDVDGDVGEGVVGGHFVDEHGGGEEEEEEDQQVAHVQRPGTAQQPSNWNGPGVVLYLEANRTQPWHDAAPIYPDALFTRFQLIRCQAPRARESAERQTWTTWRQRKTKTTRRRRRTRKTGE